MAQWTLIERLPGGHRLFTRPDSSSIWIADQSGMAPDRTEDGPMSLNLHRPLLAGDQCLVPVSRGVEDLTVLATFEDVLLLSDRYGWAIQTRESRRFRAVQVTA